MALSDEKIKQIFFYVKSNDPDGMYADNVDIFEYARKIESYVKIESARDERAECIKIVRSMNTEVAKTLEGLRKCSDRTFS